MHALRSSGVCVLECISSDPASMSSTGRGSTRDVAPKIKKQTTETTKRARAKIDWNDKGSVLWRVKHFKGNLKMAAPALQDDPQVVHAAVKLDGDSLQFASTRIRSDKEIAMHAVRQNGMALKFVSNALLDNEDLVSAAVTRDGRALQFASERLRATSSIVRQAVKTDGRSFKFALGPAASDAGIIKTAAVQVETSLRVPVSFFLELHKKPGQGPYAKEFSVRNS